MEQEYLANSSSETEATLSVIVPVYKVEKYLHQSVNSLLAQDVSPMTAFLVDDGSPDRSAQMCDEYCADPRVVVVHKKNGGLSDARNAALELAISQYVTFLDSDDYLCDAKGYSEVIRAMVSTHADMAYFSYYTFCDGEEPKINTQPIPEDTTIRKMDKQECLDFFFSKSLTWYAVVQWNKMFRRSLFDDLRYKIGSYSEDHWIMPDIEKRLQRAIIVEKKILCYRLQRKGAITSTSSPKTGYDRAFSISKTFDFALECGETKNLSSMLMALVSNALSSYCVSWRGCTDETEPNRTLYMKEIPELLKKYQKYLFSKEYVPDDQKRIGLWFFLITKYGFLVYNRIFKAFTL